MRILEDFATCNSRRVRMFLIEKGLQLPFDQVNMRQGDQDSIIERSATDLQTIPALILDNHDPIYEVSAICRYIESIQPEPFLLGSDASKKARVEMWNFRLERYLFNFLFEYRRFEIPGWGEINRPKAEEAFILLDNELTKNTYVAGQDFSLADISAFVAVNTLMQQNVIPSGDLAALNEWYGVVSSRPSAVHAPAHARIGGDEEELCSA